MAALRKQRKPSFLARGLWLAATFAALAALPGPVGAATTERVVADWHNGLAISGFDPVAYFTDGAPKPGLADFEYFFAGATWRFRNEGNRAAFAADPQVYMPQFGGYDPIAVARGVGTAGHPRLWLITGQRLYLFYSEDDRNEFARDPQGALEAAEDMWPRVLKTLAP